MSTNDTDYTEALDLQEKMAENAVSKRAQTIAASKEEQVVNTLWGFMESVFHRVDEEHAFKQEVREELRARISEMDVGMLMAFYNRLNDHENDALRTAMAPFMPKEGKGSDGSGRTLMDTFKESENSAEQTLHETASPQDLQSLGYLHTILQEAQRKKDES